MNRSLPRRLLRRSAAGGVKQPAAPLSPQQRAGGSPVAQRQPSEGTTTSSQGRSDGTGQQGPAWHRPHLARSALRAGAWPSRRGTKPHVLHLPSTRGGTSGATAQHASSDHAAPAAASPLPQMGSNATRRHKGQLAGTCTERNGTIIWLPECRGLSLTASTAWAQRNTCFTLC